MLTQIICVVYILTSAGKVTNQLVASFSLKMGERSEAKSALSSHFSEIQTDNQLVFTLPAGVNQHRENDQFLDNLFQ